MTTVITRGAGSAQALGYAARATAANYIEDVFSTYLYTGTGASQTITNGVDLSTKGGMVWLKVRSGTTGDHEIFDTARGTTKRLMTNSTSSELTNANTLTAFNSNGFSIGNYSEINGSGNGMASWTFRKQAKFFDVVTYTGNGANRTIAHNLGSVPGCIIVKRTDGVTNWAVGHRSLTWSNGILLNDTGSSFSSSTYWNNTDPTSSVFSVGTSSNHNANGGTYVAYLFAHDAGGFGASGSDNVISCGSFTADGSGNATVTLGYEPQFVMIKSSSNTSNWWMFDVMRGQPVGANGQAIYANLADAEAASSYIASPTATGLSLTGWIPSNAYIYIAIRRGPMRTPTSGTSVFSPITATDTQGQGVVKTTNFPVDLQITKSRASSGNNWTVDRLRGVSTTATDTGPAVLITNSTDAESSGTFAITRAWDNTGFQISSAIGNSAQVYWNFRRAPGFFDVVCYTGTASARTVNHNLGVAPEMIIVKNRTNGASLSIGWYVYNSNLGGNTKFLQLNTTAAVGDDGGGYWNSTSPTASVFSLGASNNVNYNGGTFVAYLFASCPGVSKVGSYTGTGTTLQVNCGFTGGARFVLIKRTDSTGDWYVWDSARGIVAGNDPYLLLNSTAAEVTNTDYVDTYSAGFEISSTAPAAINANGGTFIFLAIA